MRMALPSSSSASSSAYGRSSYGASSLFSDQLIKLAGPAANGLLLSSNFVPTNPDPNVQKFVTEYKAKYGAVPNQFAAQAYDAVGIMLVALKKAGPEVTRDSLRDALARDQGLSRRHRHNDVRSRKPANRRRQWSA